MSEESTAEIQETQYLPTPEEIITKKIEQKPAIPMAEHIIKAKEAADKLCEEGKILVGREKAYTESQAALIEELQPLEAEGAPLPLPIVRNLEQNIGPGRYQVAGSKDEVVISYQINGKNFRGRVFIFLPKSSLSEKQNIHSPISAMFVENEKGQVLLLHKFVSSDLTFALNQQPYIEESAAEGLGTFGVSPDLRHFNTIELTTVSRLRTCIHETSHALLDHHNQSSDEEVRMEKELFIAKAVVAGPEVDVTQLMVDEEGKPSPSLVKLASSYVNKRVIQEQQAWAFTYQIGQFLNQAVFIEKQELDLETHTAKRLKDYDRQFWDIPSYSFTKGAEKIFD